MFVRPRDPEMEVRDGRRAGVEGAPRQIYGRRRVSPPPSCQPLWELHRQPDELHYALGLDDDMDR
jgi:hypothetical protein